METKNASRFEKIKVFGINDMAAFLGFYFDCASCPAKRESCSENDAMCMDAICDWLKQDGAL